MKLLLTDYLGLREEFEREGVFDPLIHEDSKFYINITNLKETKVPEFKNSVLKINKEFEELFRILSNPHSQREKVTEALIERLSYGELNEINLGHSKTKHGSGIGPKLAKAILNNAREMVETGKSDPIFFHLLPLFQPGIGPDLLSDMISSIIIEDIKLYTMNVMNKLSINKENYPHMEFKNGYLVHPEKKIKIYLLPKEILNKLPLSKEWLDVNSAFRYNESVRKGFSSHVAELWKDLSVEEKKRETFESYLNNFDIVNDDYNKLEVVPYDLEEQIDYKINRFYSLRGKPITFKTPPKDSMEMSLASINSFKSWIEDTRGANHVIEWDPDLNEKTLQRLFQLSAKKSMEDFNFDMTREADVGAGIIDFKISRGTDKTIIEFKMSPNKKIYDGYTKQLESYAKAENTSNRIFVIFIVGSYEIIEDFKESILGSKGGEIIYIDLNPKESASKL